MKQKHVSSKLRVIGIWKILKFEKTEGKISKTLSEKGTFDTQSVRTMSFQELPVEIFEKILNYLDFKTVQKTCTLVCHGWLESIRESSILSGEMSLNFLKIGAATWCPEREKYFYKAGKEEDIKIVLKKWKKLHTLRIPCKIPWYCNMMKDYPIIRKVVLNYFPL